jgi:hypothetical protein
LNKLLRAGALAIVALLSIGANGNWNTHVVETDRAHVIGNPDAKVTLTEFVSYTCPHCAEFAVEGEAPLQLVYIGPGKLKVEVRSVIRNVVDLGATMLVECGPKEKFLQNHTMFMRRQGTWLAKVQQSTPAQRAVWMRGDAAGLRSMASALGHGVWSFLKHYIFKLGFIDGWAGFVIAFIFVAFLFERILRGHAPAHHAAAHHSTVHHHAFHPLFSLETGLARVRTRPRD